MLRKRLAANLCRYLSLDARRCLAHFALACSCDAAAPPNPSAPSTPARKPRKKHANPLIPAPDGVRRPEPGTVDTYHTHVLLRVPLSPEIKAKPGRGFGKGSWAWPPVVETLAPVVTAFTAIAKFGADIATGVKVSTYEPVEDDGVALAPDECELIIFPEGGAASVRGRWAPAEG